MVPSCFSFLLLLCLVAACSSIRTPAELIDVSDPEDLDAVAENQILVDGTLTEVARAEDEAIVLETLVRIAPDASAIEFEMTGTTYTLSWDGRLDPQCVCRTYADDEFKAVVYFPGKGRSGQVRISRQGNRAG